MEGFPVSSQKCVFSPRCPILAPNVVLHVAILHPLSGSIHCCFCSCLIFFAWDVSLRPLLRPLLISVSLEISAAFRFPCHLCAWTTRACFEDQKWNTSVLCGDGLQLKCKSWMVVFGGEIWEALNSSLNSLKFCADANIYCRKVLFWDWWRCINLGIQALPYGLYLKYIITPLYYLIS